MLLLSGPRRGTQSSCWENFVLLLICQFSQTLSIPGYPNPPQQFAWGCFVLYNQPVMVTLLFFSSLKFSSKVYRKTGMIFTGITTPLVSCHDLNGFLLALLGQQQQHAVVDSQKTVSVSKTTNTSTHWLPHSYFIRMHSAVLYYT